MVLNAPGQRPTVDGIQTAATEDDVVADIETQRPAISTQVLHTETQWQRAHLIDRISQGIAEKETANAQAHSAIRTPAGIARGNTTS